MFEKLLFIVWMSLFAPLGETTASSQENADCFVNVQINEGTTVGYHFENSANSCLEICQGTPGCEYFSLLTDVSTNTNESPYLRRLRPGKKIMVRG